MCCDDSLGNNRVHTINASFGNQTLVKDGFVGVAAIEVVLFLRAHFALEVYES